MPAPQPAEEPLLGWLRQPGTQNAWDLHCAPVCHACSYSQRLEALLQSCQVVCTLLQGAIESMKAIPQPMETGVSVPS